MEFGDLRQACHERPGPLAFALVQAALGQLFARDPTGASDRALPYAREQLARWPEVARWIEFGDATDPRLIPRDPRQLGLARVLVFSSPRGALDREGHARQEHLIGAIRAGATGPLELARLVLDPVGNGSLLRELEGSPELTRISELELRSGPGPVQRPIEPDAGRVTLEAARALIERAQRERACCVRVTRSACDDDALTALRASAIPYVFVERGRGY